MKLETLSSFKYIQTFAAIDAKCEECEKETIHFFSLGCNNAKMNNAKRIKQCTECLVVTEAPIEND